MKGTVYLLCEWNWSYTTVVVSQALWWSAVLNSAVWSKVEHLFYGADMRRIIEVVIPALPHCTVTMYFTI